MIAGKVVIVDAAGGVLAEIQISEADTPESVGAQVAALLAGIEVGEAA